MNEIEEIVKSHKMGEVAYHVALDAIVNLGMEQIEAHAILFPPLGEGDFNLTNPLDNEDIMNWEVIDVKGEEE